ncbi:hypothetical protein HYU13_02545 [Candidatus Woesearchaeota archaeon]|nr:hypothetical protein [Candidatus Woesearchaeota archaeon]
MAGKIKVRGTKSLQQKDKLPINEYCSLFYRFLEETEIPWRAPDGKGLLLDGALGESLQQTVDLAYRKLPGAFNFVPEEDRVWFEYWRQLPPEFSRADKREMEQGFRGQFNPRELSVGVNVPTGGGGGRGGRSVGKFHYLFCTGSFSEETYEDRAMAVACINHCLESYSRSGKMPDVAIVLEGMKTG